VGIGQEVFGLDLLRKKDLIDGLRREAAFSVKEVGDVGLGEMSLARQQGDGECAAPNFAQQLLAQVVVHLDEFHLRIVRYERWIKKVHSFFEK
jgi:hypothetical protein